MITSDEDRSSTMSVVRSSSVFLRGFLANPRLAMLTGGKSPLLRFSLNLSRCSFERLVGRILQLEEMSQIY